MHLVQILLPLADNDGHRFPAGHYRELEAELTERFGGVTAFNRAPAQGRWKDDGGQIATDEIIVFEVMDEELDRSWWQSCRARLEQRFRQDTIIVRVQPVELI